MGEEEASDGLTEYICRQIKDFRHKLLDPSTRNPLVSFKHRRGSPAFVRIIDELPDLVLEGFEGGNEFLIRPLDPPQSEPEDERTLEFQRALDAFKSNDPVYKEEAEALKRRGASRSEWDALERRARDRVRFRLRMPDWEPEEKMSLSELAERRGIRAEFDLPEPDPETVLDRYSDDELQTLYFEDELDARLRRLSERARSSVREAGVPTLYAAFGFLEWYEDETSETAHHAPLLLLSLEMSRRRTKQGRYRYFVRALEDGTSSSPSQAPVDNRTDGPSPSTERSAAVNTTLELVLRERFGLALPTFDEDDTPETYFAKVQEICSGKPRWRVRRFLTIGVFPFSKMAIYRDLDPDGGWTEPGAIILHPTVRKLVASAGDAESSYEDEYPLDDLESERVVPPLIYNADSSQHSALIDTLEGKDLAIHGPPGTGKSQTITNLIAAALAAGKTVLFVAEKQAALDVVADRLEKAGLKEFCLKIHARDARRKAVLEAFERRLNMPAPRFDEETYQRQRNKWRDQRDALKHYVDVMHNKVGALGLTIYDILWRVTQADADSANLGPFLSEVKLSDAESLSSEKIRIIEEKLKAFERSFENFSRSVDDIDQHPWRGTQRRDFTPLDATNACRCAEDWRQLTAELRVVLQCLFGEPQAEDLSFGTILASIRQLEALPSPPSDDWYRRYEAAADARMRHDVRTFAARVLRYQRITKWLAHRFECTDLNDLQAETLRELHNTAAKLDISAKSVSTLDEMVARVRARVGDWDRLLEGIRQLARLFRVDGDINGATVSALLKGAALVHDSAREVLLARTAALVDETNGPALRDAVRRFGELANLRLALEARFHLTDLPESRELREHAAVLRDRSLFSRFNQRDKAARHLYQVLSKTPAKIDARRMADDFERLSDYREGSVRLAGDERLKAILGSAFQGIDTDFAGALAVNEWASRVVEALPGVEPMRRAIRETILRGDISILDEIHTIYETVPESVRDQACKTKLSLADIDARRARECERFDSLDAYLSNVRAVGLASDQPFWVLGQAAEIVAMRRTIARWASVCDAARGFFGAAFDGPETNIAAFHDDLAYLRSLNTIGLSDAILRSLFIRVDSTHGGLGALKKSVREALGAFEQSWRRFAGSLDIDGDAFFAPETLESLTLGAIEKRAAQCAGGRSALLAWQKFQLAKADALATHGALIVESFERAGLAFSGLVKAFRLVLYRSLSEVVYQGHPVLLNLSGHQLENVRRAFCELDEKLLELERRRIASVLYRRRVEPGVGSGKPSEYTERALINYQLSLQRPSVSLRDLFRRAANATRQLMPCFMMSPYTVAQYLPQMPRTFDLVIIDEASQMRPEEAFGAITRAKQCVVVGDPKQLPPTSFFETAFWRQGDEDDAEDRLYEQVDSILDLGLRAFRPTRYLRWHYRSRYSSLIQFSNHYFYDDKLIVFPAANENDSEGGVQFREIKGQYNNHTNVKEAEAVVKEAVKFMTNQRTRGFSLGVVAINQAQRDLLMEMFERAFADEPQAVSYRRKWDGTLYPFFVKNLENVQGDERDAIFISMVYGPDASTGRVANRFGPINQNGGDKRLNVLFTRARRLVRVFSSMHANDIHLTENSGEGPRVLRQYLEYAATGRLEGGVSRPNGEVESPFEGYVKERLEAHGYEVDPQVGVASYRIDLGVKHPDYPHGYLLGVECDGATYHSAKSVRDRDRLRQIVLEELGWNIYRIWSTDWFADPDRELANLLFRLENLREESQTEVGGSLDGAEVVGRPLTQGFPHEPPSPADADLGIGVEPGSGSMNVGRISSTDADDATPIGEVPCVPTDIQRGDFGEEEVVVEVGDTVVYRRTDKPDEMPRVQIIRGPDDPANGVINDSKPLAIALLGCAEGERATVENPVRPFEVVVTKIVKPDTGPEPPTPSSQAGTQHGTADDVGDEREELSALEPYASWDGGALPDPRFAAPGRVADSLFDIIESEGPVLVARAFRIYARACNLQRVGKQIRTSLNKALSRLVRQGRVTLEDERQQGGQIYAVARIAGTPPVCLRERGPRTFDEIPFAELAAHLRLIHAELPELGREELCRELLDRYGLVRMTKAVRQTLDRVFRDFYRR